MSEQVLSPNNSIAAENEEILYLLSEITDSPYLTQRELSSKLNISLGKTNYLLKQLIKKGIIKVKNFSHSREKLNKIVYMLTKKGLKEKIKLTYHFLKVKETEYNRVKLYWEQLSNTEKQ